MKFFTGIGCKRPKSDYLLFHKFIDFAVALGDGGKVLWEESIISGWSITKGMRSIASAAGLTD